MADRGSFTYSVAIGLKAARSRLLVVRRWFCLSPGLSTIVSRLFSIAGYKSLLFVRSTYKLVYDRAVYTLEFLGGEIAKHWRGD